MALIAYHCIMFDWQALTVPSLTSQIPRRAGIRTYFGHLLFDPLYDNDAEADCAYAEMGLLTVGHWS